MLITTPAVSLHKLSQMVKRFTPKRISSYALVLLFGYSTAWAQTAVDRAEAARQAEILQRQNQERLQRDIESGIGSVPPQPGQDSRDFMPKIEVPALGPNCHPIQTIHIKDAPNLSSDLRHKLTEDFSKRCIGVNQIEQMLALVTKDYIERGYITTRAYLPSQDLTSGKLQIQVIEGVIEKIQIDDGGHHSIQPYNAFPTAPGRLLNLRDLEQGIEQINRLSSNNASLDLQPGSTAGETVVVVNNQAKIPFHASLSMDNQGSESTGRNQLGVTLAADRPLGLNELWLWTYRQSQPYDTQRKSSESDSFSLVLPFGYSTFSLTSSRSSYVTTTNTPSGLQLKANGDNEINSGKLERVLYRGQQSRISLAGALTLKDARNFLADQLLTVSSRKLTVMDLGVSATTVFLGGALTLDGGLALGLKIGGALQDPPNLPENAPKAQFNKKVYGLNFLRPFQVAGLDLTWNSQLAAQSTQDTLYGSEQFSIGGIYTVRGFNRNILFGDQGYYLRNELSLRPKFTFDSEPLSTRFYIALDLGAVRNHVAGIPEGRLVGMALGVAATWRGISLEIFNARPLSEPNFMVREAPQTWVRLTFSI